MYLPKKIENAEVLISVKTYPVPSDKYDELVCNAGFLKNGKWIRIYPIKFRSLPYDQQYSKFNWIRLNLTRRKRDFRPETYQPIQGIDEPIHVIRKVGTKNQWLERKRFALKEVFTSMSDLISLAKTKNRWKSLATLKPKEIIKFEIEPDERDWDQKMKAKLRQLQLFEKSDIDREARIVRKMPYKYYYHFLTEGDERPRRMMIEDWEIGALYWNCLAQTGGDETAANQLVEKKYFEQFVKKDLYFFVGTTLANHMRGPNPFVIIGVFYPPKTTQTSFQL